MQPAISNLTEALAYQLNELYDAEKKLREAIPGCLDKVKSTSLKNELRQYGESCRDKLVKLERVYNYLMKEPADNKSKIIDKLIENTKGMLASAMANEMKDVMLTACLHTINHYKIAGYSTALVFAEQLELDNAVDLLAEVLAWEKKTNSSLLDVAVYDVNTKASEYGKSS
ncbi:Hypothetical protein C900_03825 [Fulvivirga imtechensis AK7]|uniref:Uncharacterized protein n=1 Tax=Fulvivirga imtechensis AK7 TaxID=1237149 RepID=L8JMS9_9BACT|nr:DUF892 family protein [Fulvivirga imtechensis]ELR70140.1 Hypothetical protein C900_03825 [Fulvivirga imtechensis AK7]